jgi:hypothetical protein
MELRAWLRSGAAVTVKSDPACAQASSRCTSAGVKGVFFTSRAVKFALLEVTVTMWSAGFCTPRRRRAATAVVSARSISRGGRNSRRITFSTPFSLSLER